MSWPIASFLVTLARLVKSLLLIFFGLNNIKSDRFDIMIKKNLNYFCERKINKII